MKQEVWVLYPPTLSIHWMRAALGRKHDLDKPAHFGQDQLLESHQSPVPSPSGWCHEHLRPEGGASGGCIVVSSIVATVVNKITHVKCLVRFLMLLKFSENYDDHSSFSWKSALGWSMEFARWLGEYDVGGEWDGFWVWVKVREHGASVGTGLKTLHLCLTHILLLSLETRVPQETWLSSPSASWCVFLFLQEFDSPRAWNCLYPNAEERCAFQEEFQWCSRSKFTKCIFFWFGIQWKTLSFFSLVDRLLIWYRS